MGMRAAINAMCKQCLYDPRAEGLGTWRQQIEACTATDCPLYAYRPTSRGTAHLGEESGRNGHGITLPGTPSTG